jgi:hypothetical protein
VRNKLADIFDIMLTKYGSIETIPNVYAALRTAMFNYETAAQSSVNILTRVAEANRRIKSAKQNIAVPSAANKGLQINATEYYVGYENLPTANYLLDGLKNKNNSITVKTLLRNFHEETSDLHIEAKIYAGFKVSSFIKVDVSGDVSYDISKYSKKESVVDIGITYPGITAFAPTMMEHSPDSKKGWYENMILSQIIKKTGDDKTTVYKLNSYEFDVDELFGKGKKFGRLKTFVISQEPTISLKMSKVDIKKVKEDFKRNGEIKVTLLGIINVDGGIGGKAKYTVQNITEEEESSSIILKFGPAKAGGSTPLQDQVAHVMGGVASYPPNEI